MVHNIGLKTLTCRETQLTLNYIHIKHNLWTSSNTVTPSQERLCTKCVTLETCHSDLLCLLSLPAFYTFSSILELVWYRGTIHILVVKAGCTKCISDFKMTHFKAEVASNNRGHNLFKRVIESQDVFIQTENANLFLNINQISTKGIKRIKNLPKNTKRISLKTSP